MSVKYIVAIDGPAGAGKSTIARMLAKKLRYVYIDSGAMYRAVTWKAMKSGYDLNDPVKLVSLARNTMLEFKKYKNKITLFADGKAVGREIRTTEVTANICHLADNGGVRKVMVKRQQQTAQGGGIVMEGRDIGTKVFPRAEFKFFLDASVDERARRRYREYQERGVKVNLSDIRRDIMTRDRKDKTRAVSPLRQAADAVVIDSSRLTPRQVVDAMLKVIRK